MPGPASEFCNALADGVEAALRDQAAKIQDAKRADLSKPVGYRTGPRGGRYAIRSRPGEFPRRETGRLQAGMVAEVTRAGLTVELTVNDPVPYARPLQQIDRIVTSDVPERFTDAVANAVATAIATAIGGNPP